MLQLPIPSHLVILGVQVPDWVVALGDIALAVVAALVVVFILLPLLGSFFRPVRQLTKANEDPPILEPTDWPSELAWAFYFLRQGKTRWFLLAFSFGTVGVTYDYWQRGELTWTLVAAIGVTFVGLILMSVAFKFEAALTLFILGFLASLGGLGWWFVLTWPPF